MKINLNPSNDQNCSKDYVNHKLKQTFERKLQIDDEIRAVNLCDPKKYFSQRVLTAQFY